MERKRPALVFMHMGCQSKKPDQGRWKWVINSYITFPSGWSNMTKCHRPTGVAM